MGGKLLTIVEDLTHTSGCMFGRPFDCHACSYDCITMLCYHIAGFDCFGLLEYREL